MSTAASQQQNPASPVRADSAQASDLRRDLEGWTVDAIGEIMGDVALRALDREQVVPAVLAARASDDRLAVLTRLAMLGDTVTRAEAQSALPSLGVDGAVATGLIEAAGRGLDDEVRALVDLRPTSSVGADGELTWWMASDQAEAVTGSRLAPDHVLGMGGASAMLASATMRVPRSRVLDLGTGCGIQAMHASLHADTVVATDISRRALAFAEFNRELNAPPAAWSLREGSMLEPVARDVAQGSLFDLVVSNPPFVITPQGAPSFEYRHGGLPGDAIVESLISNVGSVLAPGGVAQMLGNWEIRRGTDWRERLGDWLDASAAAGFPMDAWVIQRDALDGAEYAETWLRDGGVTPERGREEYEDAYRAYLADFASRDVETVGFGIVTLRRAPADRAPMRRLEEHEGQLPSPLGAHIVDVLAAHDWLAQTSDDALLATALTVASDVTKETYGRPLLHEPEHILIRQGGGLGRSVRADTALAGLVGACDGELTVGQISHALAALLDVPSGTMLAGMVPAVRDLVRDGFLVR
ncbi:DUF7059 domain-containing protein [Demequina oxidasica]|uniref:DUF7059 domain-containing protein n=1 Tax=Demequina oxidasica TaxID=676199 RepID=UPI0007811975|nr:methyltransferase [Demequina oxidasica]